MQEWHSGFWLGCCIVNHRLDSLTVFITQESIFIFVAFVSLMFEAVDSIQNLLHKQILYLYKYTLVTNTQLKTLLEDGPNPPC